MLKLIQYEYRRNLTSIAVMLGAILLLQCFYLFSVFKKDVNLVVPAAALLFIAAIFCAMGMMIYSVALYSRELNAKTSYLTFMTPHRASKVLGAKLISALLLGLFFAAILGVFGSWDISLLIRAFPQLELVRVLTEEMLPDLIGQDLATVLNTIAAMGIEFLINFFTFVMVAYLAITLSATVLQNKKLKGLVSLLIFIAIMAALEWGVSLLPVGSGYTTVLDALLAAWPKYAAYLVVIAGAFTLSAWLLENKVSL
jgi:hypothetical protein